MAVSCVNMTAERLSKYRFSVPVQEDGVSVMVRKEPFHIWTPVVRTLFSLDLLELLGGILAFILAMALVIWKIENTRPGVHPKDRQAAHVFEAVSDSAQRSWHKRDRQFCPQQHPDRSDVLCAGDRSFRFWSALYR